jgi:hypothetical protein
MKKALDFLLRYLPKFINVKEFLPAKWDLVLHIQRFVLRCLASSLFLNLPYDHETNRKPIFCHLSRLLCSKLHAYSPPLQLGHKA